MRLARRPSCRALRCLIILLAVAVWTAWTLALGIASAHADAVVSDINAGTGFDGALFRVDATGVRTLLSDFGNPAQGPTAGDPRGVAVESSGGVLVIASSAGTGSRGALFRVNAAGIRTLLSDFGNPAQGPLGGFGGPRNVAIEASGAILVTDFDGGTGGLGQLFRVDRVTGNRTLLSDFGNAAQGPPAAGTFGVAGVAVEASGAILVVDMGSGTPGKLFRVDPVTGNRTLLSDFANAAQGPLGLDPNGVAVERSGAILVVDQNVGAGFPGALFRVDPLTGNRTLLSDFGNAAQGPLGVDPVGVAVESSGAILVVDEKTENVPAGALFRVDPLTGNRTLLSDFQNAAQGPKGFDPIAVAVVAGGPTDPSLTNSEFPGSAIVFPKFHRGTLANGVAQTTFEIGVVCPNNFGQEIPPCPQGQAVKIKLHWVCPATVQKGGAGFCQSQDFELHTTVNGKLEFDAAGRVTVGPFDLNGGIIPIPQCDAGYLIAYVIRPTDDAPISFNGLIGEEVLRLRVGSSSGYNGITFQSPLATGFPTDVNANGALDFDGLEYKKAPARFAADVRFEKTASPQTLTFLTTLTLDIRQNNNNPNLVAPVNFYRANEVPLSDTVHFTCWREQRLTDINTNLNQARMGTKGMVVSTGPAVVASPCTGPGCAAAGTPTTTLAIVTTLEDIPGNPREYGYRAYGLGEGVNTTFDPFPF